MVRAAKYYINNAYEGNDIAIADHMGAVHALASWDFHLHASSGAAALYEVFKFITAVVLKIDIGNSPAC